MAGAIIDMVSQHWGTPNSLLEPTRYVLGEIDLDPCSNGNALDRVCACNAVWLPDEAGQWQRPICECGCALSMTLESLPPQEVCQACMRPWEPASAPLPESVIVGDGLGIDWTHFQNVFCNPPYGRSANGISIYNWVMKGAVAGRHTPVLMLIPAAVGTKHWQNIIFDTADKICFLRGRVKFLLPGKDNVSTTPSAMVLWGGAVDDGILTRFHEAFEPLGKIV
jgi:hypothetical protein